MTKNTIEFGGSDKLALEYIRQRGYASYSSMTNVRDKKDPQVFKEMPYHRFGKELHSRFLEHKKLVRLSLADGRLRGKYVKRIPARSGEHAGLIIGGVPPPSSAT
jgi:hypothetical protein